MRANAREYCIRPESDEAFVISFLGDEGVHGLGYEEDSGDWVKFYSTDMDHSDGAFDGFEDSIYEWAESQYGDRLESGDLRMVGPDDPSIEDDQSETPKEESSGDGLEPEYDCPAVTTTKRASRQARIAS